MSDRVAVGIDVGGSHLRIGLVEPSGRLLASERQRHDASAPGAEALAVAAGAALALLDAHGLEAAAAGIAASGPIDAVTGIVSNPWTLPGWSGLDVRAPLEQRLAVPVVAENDADAAALGEALAGAGAGIERVVVVTVGTGIGVGLVDGGRIVRGAGGRHAEAGHHVVAGSGPRCYCGLDGCWEQLASGTALEREAQAPAEDVAEAAEHGNPSARALVERVGEMLGRGLRNLDACLAPDLIVVGGGLGERFDLLRAAVERGRSPASLLNPPAPLAPAALGDRAGVVGAGLAALRRPTS
jgi:glucokinase